MNDATDLPPDHEGAPGDLPLDDDAVAAVIDGEATAEQVARVAADPVLQAVVASRQALRAQLAEIPALPETVARRTLEAALATFDAAQAGDDTARSGPDAVTVAPVVPLAARPTAPRPTAPVQASRRRRPSVAWLGAAAAVVALVAGGAIALSDRPEGDGDMATSMLASDASDGDASELEARPEADGEARAGGGAAEDETALTPPDATATSTASGPSATSEAGGDDDRFHALLVDLGSFDDPAAVQVAADEAQVAGGAVLGDQAAGTPCVTAVLDAEPSGATAAPVALLTYQGSAALLVGVTPEGAPGVERLVVVAEDGCDVLARLPGG